jgi:hypothetical protein
VSSGPWSNGLTTPEQIQSYEHLVTTASLCFCYNSKEHSKYGQKSQELFTLLMADSYGAERSTLSHSVQPKGFFIPSCSFLLKASERNKQQCQNGMTSIGPFNPEVSLSGKKEK